MPKKKKPDFSSLQICTVLKPKKNPILQILEIGNNKYILLLPFEGDIEIYTKKLEYQFSIPQTIHDEKISKVTELKNRFLITNSEDYTANILQMDYPNKKY